MKVIPKRTFLLKQVEDEKEKSGRKDVLAKKGVAMDVNESDYFQFERDFDLPKGQKAPARKKN